MALELTIWILLISVSILTFLFGLTYKISFAFLIGCILLAISGISLFAYGGLLLDQPVEAINFDGSITYSENIVPIENTALFGVGLLLILFSFISFFMIDFSGVKQKRDTVFHY